MLRRIIPTAERTVTWGGDKKPLTKETRLENSPTDTLQTVYRKLHELIAVAITENWTIICKHNQRMAGILEQIIASGMAAGEFHPGDAALAARLVNTACIRFCHPRLMVEYEQESEPVLDQMVDFCLAALVPHPHSAIRPDACATE
jgi:hypothetical protein